MKILIAPIFLKISSSLKFPVIIEEGILIKDFAIESREEFFGVKDLKVEGTKVSYRQKSGRDIFRESWSIGMDYFSLLRAESCIEISGEDNVPTPKLQHKMHFTNDTLKILKSGNAGVLITRFMGETRKGFPGGIRGIISYSPTNPLYGESYVLKKEDIPELKNLYKIISKRKDEKTKMLTERFMLSISKNLQRHTRSLQFFSILESLYLPGIEHGELRFRLAQRMAKTLCSHKKRHGVYKEIKKLYDKRSILVHQSKDQFTNEELNKLENLTRTSLKLFLKTPELFEVIYLEKLDLR